MVGDNNWRDRKGNICASASAHFGDLWPKSGLDASQLWCPASVSPRAQAAAAAEARANAKARAKANAEAAAALAAENRWHKGYTKQDENVYWQWRNSASCQEFATNGCWHVAVITRDGCSTYVAVNANEYQGGAIVNQLLDNQGYGIPPKTVRIFELDSDSGANTTASDVTVDCQ